jgi:hypothetical protein
MVIPFFLDFVFFVLEKSVAKLLMDERSRWVKHNIQGWYVLQVVIWIDNCDADTAGDIVVLCRLFESLFSPFIVIVIVIVMMMMMNYLFIYFSHVRFARISVKIRLCDPLTLLLPTFVSPVAPFMTWLGGEEIMHLVCSMLLPFPLHRLAVNLSHILSFVVLLFN